MYIVEVKELLKKYGENESEVIAVNNINLKIQKGEFVAIIGSSGSGKSTLLHIIGGLEKQTSGEVMINGKVLSDMREKELTVFRRRHIGFVFQSFNLISSLNVEDNIKLSCELDNKSVDEKEMALIINKLQLQSKLKTKISKLSGGQQQRVAIARALISKPDIILADEPTGNLDSKNSKEVMELFTQACKEYNQTVLMITHDEKVASMADRVVRIEDGVLYEK